MFYSYKHIILRLGGTLKVIPLLKNSWENWTQRDWVSPIYRTSKETRSRASHLILKKPWFPFYHIHPIPQLLRDETKGLPWTLRFLRVGLDIFRSILIALLTCHVTLANFLTSNSISLSPKWGYYRKLFHKIVARTHNTYTLSLRAQPEKQNQ